MRLYHLHQEQWLPISLTQAWEFFSSPRNLEVITPKDIGFEIISGLAPKMFDGQIIEYRIKIAPAIKVTWVTEIKCVTEGHSFIDEQRFGPYRFWHHRHTFTPHKNGITMHDDVHYALPLGIIGQVAHALFVQKKLQRIFSSRRTILESIFSNPPPIITSKTPHEP